MHSYSQSSVKVENSKEAADNNVWMVNVWNEVSKNRWLTAGQTHPFFATSIMGLPDDTTVTENVNSC